MTDASLVQDILQGDAAAERRLYDLHVDRVFRLAYRMTGDDALAQDATQDTFIRAFDKLGEWRGDGPLGGWLHRVATTVILGHLRKRKRVQSREAQVEDVTVMAGARVDGDPLLRRSIDLAVDELDDNHRLVFVMHDMEGYTHREIADAMGTPVGTAKARLSRARSRLRELLLGTGPMPLPEPE
ncbi:MAG: RNA polymerase sigma factor [bacterium]|nr:RNA polymerase sigma factor [bacterium]